MGMLIPISSYFCCNSFAPILWQQALFQICLRVSISYFLNSYTPTRLEQQFLNISQECQGTFSALAVQF